MAKNPGFHAPSQASRLWGQPICGSGQADAWPKGRSVTISTPDGRPSITKHGLLIADSMNPEDPWQAKGVAMIKAAARQNGDFGDAASMIAVLTQSMLDNADRAAAQGIDPGA